MLTITPWDHFGWMCALVRCQDGFYPAHGKNTLGGARTHDHKIKSLALYHLSYEGNSYGKQKVENPGFDPGASRLQSAHSTD